MVEAKGKTKAQAKGKAKRAPQYGEPGHVLYDLVQAMRLYERTSYYLATQGEINMEADEQAQELFHSFDPSNADELVKLAKNRCPKVPKGNFLDGLAIRTEWRMAKSPAKKGNRS